MSFQNKIFVSIFLSLLLFFILIYAIVPISDSTLITLAMTIVSGALSIIVLCFYFSKIGFLTYRVSILVLVFYLIRVFIGVIHYVYVFNGNYFNSAVDFNYLWDYQWLHEAMVYLSDYWNINGFGIPPPEYVLAHNKYVGISVYMSLYYYLGGNNHYLNIIAINSFHAVLVAVLVSSVSKRLIGDRESRDVLLIGLIQPFGFASSIFWRDSIGQLFVISGIIMITSAEINLKGLLITFIASFLMLLQRMIYPIVGISIYLTKIFIRKSYLKSIKVQLALALFVILIIFYGRQVYDLSLGDYLVEDSSLMSLGWSPVPLSQRIIKSLVGPFPWYQIFNPMVTGREYLFFDMLQSSFCLVIICMLIYNIYFKMQNINENHVIIIMSALYFMISGVISYGHTPYVTVATIIIIGIINNFKARTFIYLWSITILLYMVGSLIWYLIDFKDNFKINIVQ